MTALAILATVATAAAQSRSEVPPATRTVRLTLEQRHIIRELIAESKSAVVPMDAPVAVGQPVPREALPQPIPPLLGQKVPQIKSHRFFVTHRQIILVEPGEDRIAEVID